MRTRRMHQILGVALAGPLLAGGLPAVAAAQWVLIDETRALRPGATVELTAATHAIRVEPWDRSEIRITGAYEPRREEVEVRGTEHAFFFEISHTDQRRSRPRREPHELRVRIPPDVRLLVHTASGAIHVRGVTNSLEAGSASGDVTVTGNAARVDLSTVSGRLSYDGDSPWVQLSGVSAPVEYRGRAVDLRAGSTSGKIIVEGQVETLELRSTSAPIRANLSEPVRSLRMNTVSGALQFTGALAPSGRISVESHSGSVDLDLEPNTEATFEIHTFSGGIQADIPGMTEVVRTRGRYTPEERMVFVTGTGSAQVKVSSFSGSVRIRSAGG